MLPGFSCNGIVVLIMAGYSSIALVLYSRLGWGRGVESLVSPLTFSRS